MASKSAELAVSTPQSDWDIVADGWDADQPALDAWLTLPTRSMIVAAGIERGDHVLDVAAGGGHQTVAIARQVGSAGRITCIDNSPALIDRLRRSAVGDHFPPIEARLADAQHALAEHDAFDAAVCRLGLMLLPDPALCLASVYGALKPGARFSAMVFAGPEDNPCIRAIMTTALRHAELPPRDPFAPGGLLSLGFPGRLGQMFEAAGFRAVSTQRIDAPFRLPSVEAYIDFLQNAAAPVLAVLDGLPASARQAAWSDIRRQLSGYQSAETWVGPNTLLLTTGCK